MERALEYLSKDTNAANIQEFERTTIESRMVRFRYGPWDERYRRWIGLLIAKGLAHTFVRGRTIHVEITEKGKQVAEQLANLSELEILNLGSNKIREIKGLDNLENLEILHLISNEIKEIKGLENLHNLKELYLRGNQIEELKGLENLTSLQRLDLSWNNISKIQGLDNLTNLEVLWIAGNQLQKIENLENQKNQLGK